MQIQKRGGKIAQLGIRNTNKWEWYLEWRCWFEWEKKSYSQPHAINRIKDFMQELWGCMDVERWGGRRIHH